MITKLNGNAKLDEAQVRNIRYMLDTKQATAAELARDLRMNVETIRRIGRRENWGWVPELPHTEVQGWKTGAESSYAKLLALQGQPAGAGDRESTAGRMAREVAEAKAATSPADGYLDELTRGEGK